MLSTGYCDQYLKKIIANLKGAIALGDENQVFKTPTTKKYGFL